MIHVALTGNVAAGKSTVAELFRRWGATVIDADRLVRESQEPGSPVLEAIVRRFGGGVLQADGHLDRARLRALILADEAARRDLEALVHPEVQRRQAALVDAARRRGDAVVVSDIPLLFEAGDPGAYDAVVLVDAPDAVRRRRLVTLRGLPDDEAARLIATQLPAADKRRRSTHVIDNDGDPAALEARARAVWTALTGA